MRTTSGSTASVRAMQRRCCCPPESPSALFFSLSFSSSQIAACPQRPLDDLVKLRLLADAVRARTVGDVIVHAHGEGVRLLKHHAHALSERVDVHFAVQVDAVDEHLARDLAVRNESFMRLSDFKKVDLPQPEGPMNAVISFSRISILMFLSAQNLP